MGFRVLNNPITFHLNPKSPKSWLDDIARYPGLSHLVFFILVGIWLDWRIRLAIHDWNHPYHPKPDHVLILNHPEPIYFKGAATMVRYNHNFSQGDTLIHWFDEDVGNSIRSAPRLPTVLVVISRILHLSLGVQQCLQQLPHITKIWKELVVQQSRFISWG
jgi:hypothetical protein